MAMFDRGERKSIMLTRFTAGVRSGIAPVKPPGSELESSYAVNGIPTQPRTLSTRFI